MPQDLLPPEVARVLATRGTVQLVAGAMGSHASVRCGIAPFEDLLFLFIRPGTNVETALLESTEAQVNAKDPDGAWFVRMGGRAVAGLPLMKHERRLEMLPWVPETEEARGLIVISFWPEDLEYVRGIGGDEERFNGKTPAGLPRSQTNAVGILPMAERWRQLSFRGINSLVVISWALIFLYLGVLGPETPLRLLALGIGTLASVTLLGGARLWYRAKAFVRWRQGRCRAEDAGLLLEGLLPLRRAERASAQMLAFGLALTLATASWGTTFLVVTLTSTGLWMVWPLWAIHLAQSEPEPLED